MIEDSKKVKAFEKAKILAKGTLLETLEMELVDVGQDFVRMKMPVTKKVCQPESLLHGGATAALAETAGSLAAYVLVDEPNVVYRGIELSINHIKSVKEGKWVYAKATAIHRGRTTQLWDIRITDDDDNLVSVSKLTTITLSK